MSEHTGHGLCMWRNTGVGAGDNKMIRVHGTFLLVVRSTRVRAGENKMSEHTGHGSCMWRALGLEQEMLNYWSTWIIEDRCREAMGLKQERIECWSTQDMAYACGETLGLEQEIIK